MKFTGTQGIISEDVFIDGIIENFVMHHKYVKYQDETPVKQVKFRLSSTLILKLAYVTMLFILQLIRIARRINNIPNKLIL